LNELLGITAMNPPHFWRVFADGAMLPPPSLKKPSDRKDGRRENTPHRPLSCRVRQIMAFEHLRGENDYECPSEHSKKAFDPKSCAHETAPSDA
jgi:hypothetical protein